MPSSFVGCANIATLAHCDAVRRGHPLHQSEPRQLGRYQAPVPEARVSPDSGPVAAPPPAPSDRSSDVAEQTRLMQRGRLAARQQLFDEIRALFEGGNSIGDIARKLSLGRRRVERWVRRIDLPDRNTMASTPSNPAYFSALLERRWAEGITRIRHLLARDTPSRLYGVLHSSGAFPFPMA